MNIAAIRTHQDAYSHYVEEGATLLGQLFEGAHLAERAGRLFFVTEIVPPLADALSNWGAELAELEPEDML